MLNFIIKRIVGSQNDRLVKKMRPLVKQINDLEDSLKPLTDDQLREKTAAWKAELSKIEDLAELAVRLEEILPEAYAEVKAACRRLCGQEIMVRGHPLKWEMIPFDVQLIGVGQHGQDGQSDRIGLLARRTAGRPDPHPSAPLRRSRKLGYELSQIVEMVRLAEETGDVGG